MQTFLPYPDFAASAVALDPLRLGKQRVETIQVLRGLTVATYGWRHHPAVKMWAGYEEALVRYGLAMAEAWCATGRADTTADTLTAELAAACGVASVRAQADLAAAGDLPPWLGDPAFHRSHQSALVRKDPDRYRPRFGDVPDDLPYVWPPSDRPKGCVPDGGPPAPPSRHTARMAEFRATVILGGKTATGIEVPEPVVTTLGRGKRPAVTATVAGYTYRTTVAPMAGSYWIPLAAEHRAEAGVAAGDEVDVRLELDTAPRTVDVPADLAAALDAAAGARAAFDALSYSNQRRHVLAVEGAKTAETRQRRVAKVVAELG